MPTESEVIQRAKNERTLWRKWEKDSSNFASQSTGPTSPDDIPEFPFNNKGEQKTQLSVIIPLDARNAKDEFSFRVICALINAVRDVYPTIKVGRVENTLVFVKDIGEKQAIFQADIDMEGNLITIDVRYLVIYVRDGHAGDIDVVFKKKPSFREDEVFSRAFKSEFRRGLSTIAISIPPQTIMTILLISWLERFGIIPVSVIFVTYCLYVFRDYDNRPDNALIESVKWLLVKYGQSLLLAFPLSVVGLFLHAMNTGLLSLYASLLSLLAMMAMIGSVPYLLFVRPHKVASSSVNTTEWTLERETQAENDRRLQDYESSSFQVFVDSDTNKLLERDHAHRGFFNQIFDAAQVVTAKFLRGT